MVQQMSEPENVNFPSDASEVIENEDGSVDINYGEDLNLPPPEDHNANLAEYLDETESARLSSSLIENYKDYKTSRKDWEHTYTTGLDLLGFKYEKRSEPFQGASGATHPVLAEAVTQFQALAYKELLPATGPVRTQLYEKGRSRRTPIIMVSVSALRRCRLIRSLWKGLNNKLASLA